MTLSSTMTGRSHMHRPAPPQTGPQSDGVHRLRMADSQGRGRCKTSAARQRLEWFQRQIVTSSESPVDSEPPVDLFSALLTLLTLRIECRLRRRLCYRKPTCTEFRQPPLSPHPKLRWSWGLRGFNVDNTNTNDDGPRHPADSLTMGLLRNPSNNIPGNFTMGT